MTHKKSKVPYSIIENRIQQGVQEQLKKRGNADFKVGYEKGQQDLQAIVNASESEKIQKLNLTIASLQSQLGQQDLQLSEKRSELKRSATRNVNKTQQIVELESKVRTLETQAMTLDDEHQSLAALGFVDTSIVVPNWKSSIKWISTWCFGLIAFFAVTPIPPEVLLVLPDDIRTYLIAFTAFCGFVGRYINQNK